MTRNNTNEDILTEVKIFLEKNFKKAQRTSQHKKSEGKVRYITGNAVEEMCEFIWNALAKRYYKIPSAITVGGKTPLIITNAGGFISASVDRHCFIDNKMVLAIECKTYVDKCFLQRGNDDFRLIKKGCSNIITWMVAFQDACKTETYNFFMDEGNISDTFFLSSVRRVSSKHISENAEIIEDERIMKLIENMENIFLQYRG